MENDREERGQKIGEEERGKFKEIFPATSIDP